MRARGCSTSLLSFVARWAAMIYQSDAVATIPSPLRVAPSTCEALSGSTAPLVRRYGVAGQHSLSVGTADGIGACADWNLLVGKRYSPLALCK